MSAGVQPLVPPPDPAGLGWPAAPAFPVVLTASAGVADAVGDAELAVAVGPAVALGAGQAFPYAAGGSAWRRASAATEARVAAAVPADG